MRDNRQQEVSTKLLDLLINLIECEELHEHGNFLMINASHALIRWLDATGPDCTSNIDSVMKLIHSTKTEIMIKANLVLALYMNGVITPKLKSVLRYDGDLNKVWVHLWELTQLLKT